MKAEKLRENMRKFKFVQRHNKRRNWIAKFNEVIPHRYMRITYMMLTGVLALVLIFYIIWYHEHLTGFAPKEKSYQYVSGMEMKYGKDVEFHLEDNKVLVSNAKGSSDAAESPLLYPKSKKITLMKDMLLMIPSESTELQRINCFTDLEAGGERITFCRNKKSAKCYGGFLYDGENTYVFLENTRLIVGGYEVLLPPLSYAVANYGESLEYYNSENGTCEVISIVDSKIEAKCDSGYTLVLDTDVLYTKTQEILLFSAVDTVEPMKLK